VVVPGGYTPRSDEGNKKLNELMELCTKLFEKVTSLEQDLKHTKQVYGKALTKLVKKVKHLEDQLKSTTKKRKAKVVISDKEEDLVLEDPSKQGRMPKTKYEDVETEHSEEESSEKKVLKYFDVLSAAKILADAFLRKDFQKLHQKKKVRKVTVTYQSFEDMVKGFDRKDLVALCSLVKEGLDLQSSLKIWRKLYGLN
ncbi:hypothetical protein Tco_0068473, partial [Tanacetum coccineum]